VQPDWFEFDASPISWANFCHHGDSLNKGLSKCEIVHEVASSLEKFEHANSVIDLECADWQEPICCNIILSIGLSLL
jgi:hypothetical protein